VSTKVHGLGAGHCDVCGRSYTWGCGHSGSQERDFRRHYATGKHKRRECECYGHDHCDPAVCNLAGTQIVGYVPFHQHTEDPREDLDDFRRRYIAVLAVTEPQHLDLHPLVEHGQQWVDCRTCGRQWAIHGSTAEVVSEGDGYCDEHAKQ